MKLNEAKTLKKPSLETKFGYFLLLAPLVPEIYIAYTENILSKTQSCWRHEQEIGTEIIPSTAASDC